MTAVRSLRAAPAGARQVAQALVLAAPVLWITAVGWTHRWMTEDGFIYLRVVRQIREGHGPVFNQGERVEAFTGVLWVGILSVADLLTPVRLEWLAILLGLATTAAGVTLSLAGAHRLWSPLCGRPLWLPFGALVFVAILPVWAYATSGLETGLVFAWLGACLWILAGWAHDAERQVTLPAAVVLGLGWLVRPELVLFSALFLAAVVAGPWSGGTWRAQARLVAAALAAPAAYQIFRMGFYGSLVANTAIAKEGSRTNWERGWDYFLDFGQPYWLWVPVLCLLAGGYVPLASAGARAGDVRRLVVMGAFLLGSVLSAVYVIGVGGDYHHGRMFLPALFAACAPVALVPATRRHLAAIAIGAWAVVAAVFLRPEQYQGDDWLANGFLAPRRFGLVTKEHHGWGDDRQTWYQGPAYYAEVGLGGYVRVDLDLDDDVTLPFGALWGIGVSAYSLGPDFHVLDQMGLADVFTSHLELTPVPSGELPRFPGHEKPLPSPWLAARVTRPGSAPAPSDFPALGGSSAPGDDFDEQVAWARAALACDSIAGLLQAADEPLTAGRFSSNLLHSVQRTRMRIPADPEEAYRRFCGDGTPPEVIAARGAASERSQTETTNTESPTPPEAR